MLFAAIFELVGCGESCSGHGAQRSSIPCASVPMCLCGNDCRAVSCLSTLEELRVFDTGCPRNSWLGLSFLQVAMFHRQLFTLSTEPKVYISLT